MSPLPAEAACNPPLSLWLSGTELVEEPDSYLFPKDPVIPEGLLYGKHSKLYMDINLNLTQSFCSLLPSLYRALSTLPSQFSQTKEYIVNEPHV